MPAKKKTTENKTVAKTTAKEVKKPAVKSTKVSTAKVSAPKEKVVEKEQSNPIAEEAVKPIKPRKVKISSRVLYTVAAILGLILIALLANKYLVVAWVNNKPVTWLEYYSDLDKRYGKDLKEELIVEKLLVDEGREKGVNPTDQEIDAEIQKIESEQGGKDKFDEILTSQGISRKDLRKLVGLQIIRKKLFEKDSTVSAEEIDKYIADNKAQLPEVDEKLKQNIQDQLVQQKASDAFNTWLAQAINSSKVIRH